MASEHGPSGLGVDGRRRNSRSSELQRASSGGSEQALPRPSTDGSTGSLYSPAGSARSSFALERASVEANRASLEAFHHAFTTGALIPSAGRTSTAGAAAHQQQQQQPAAAATGAGADLAGAAAAGVDGAGGPALTLDQLVLAAALPSALREK